MKAEQSSFDKIRTRPRFKLITSLSSDEYADRLKIYLEKNKDHFSGNVNRESATISVKTEDDAYWKPRLTLRAEKEDEKTVIRGVFGPSSAVWTFFMFLYFIFGILWMVFITFWFVGIQIKSDDYQWALSVSFLMLILIALTYLAARYGQNKAKNEMEQLRNFAVESTLKYEERPI